MDKILVTRSSMPAYEEYIEMIKPIWESHWLTNMGVYHKELELKLKEYLKANNISLMVNGHMALELAISAMHFPRGSEIITTPFTFISTTHAIVRCGLNPVFCDIKPDDYTINETKIEKLITEKTVAILPVHVYGNVCAVDEINRIAKKYNLKVIYDAAHAFGVEYNHNGIGIYGDASCFSFHATKVFNTIEGGAVTFNNPELTSILYDLKNFGIRSEEVVAEVGANAKMNEFSAAMGLCNLKYIAEEIQKRKKVVTWYCDRLKAVEGIQLYQLYSNLMNENEGISEQEDITHNNITRINYAYFPILVDETKYGRTRDDIYNSLREKNIFSRKYFYPLTSDQACFRNKYQNVDLQIARYVADRILVLPLYADMTEEIVDAICNEIINI